MRLSEAGRWRGVGWWLPGEELRRRWEWRGSEGGRQECEVVWWEGRTSKVNLGGPLDPHAARLLPYHDRQWRRLGSAPRQALLWRRWCI